MLALSVVVSCELLLFKPKHSVWDNHMEHLIVTTHDARVYSNRSSDCLLYHKTR